MVSLGRFSETFCSSLTVHMELKNPLPVAMTGSALKPFSSVSRLGC